MDACVSPFGHDHGDRGPRGGRVVRNFERIGTPSVCQRAVTEMCATVARVGQYFLLQVAIPGPLCLATYPRTRSTTSTWAGRQHVIPLAGQAHLHGVGREVFSARIYLL